MITIKLSHFRKTQNSSAHVLKISAQKKLPTQRHTRSRVLSKPLFYIIIMEHLLSKLKLWGTQHYDLDGKDLFSLTFLPNFWEVYGKVFVFLTTLVSSGSGKQVFSV